MGRRGSVACLWRRLAVRNPEYYDLAFKQDRAMGDVIVTDLAGVGPIPWLFGLLDAFKLANSAGGGVPGHDTDRALPRKGRVL